MQIAKDTVVQFHYSLTDDKGQALENSRGSDPIAYLHGHGGMLDGVAEAMEGKAKGDKFETTLAPEKTYGEYKQQEPQRVSKKHLVNKGKISVGDVIGIKTKEGVAEATVVKVGLKNVDVDPNHPYAGKTLTFDIEVIDVRAGTEEEIAHGHAHGVGGHQH